MNQAAEQTKEQAARAPLGRRQIFLLVAVVLVLISIVELVGSRNQGLRWNEAGPPLYQGAELPLSPLAQGVADAQLVALGPSPLHAGKPLLELLPGSAAQAEAAYCFAALEVQQRSQWYRLPNAPGLVAGQHLAGLAAGGEGMFLDLASFGNLPAGAYRLILAEEGAGRGDIIIPFSLE